MPAGVGHLGKTRHFDAALVRAKLHHGFRLTGRAVGAFVLQRAGWAELVKPNILIFGKAGRRREPYYHLYGTI